MKQSATPRVVMSVFFAAVICTLAFSPISTFAATPTFEIGRQVVTTGTTNVRAIADGTLVGTQPRFAVGDIVAGPVTVPGNSVTWYKVNFLTSPSGWIGVDMLINGVAPPNSVVVGKGQNQSMILDELGNIEVGFTSSFDANHNPIYSFSESTNQGLTFSPPSILPMLPLEIPAPVGPQIAAERNGAIDLVYTCPPSECPASIGVTSIQLVRSIDHGVTWSAPIQISVPSHPSESGADGPVIAACGAGVTVAWTDDGKGSNNFMVNSDIFVMQVLNGVPGTPINVTNTVGDEFLPQIVVNPQGTVYLTWYDNNNVTFAAIPNCAAVQN